MVVVCNFVCLVHVKVTPRINSSNQFAIVAIITVFYVSSFQNLTLLCHRNYLQEEPDVLLSLSKKTFYLLP